MVQALITLILYLVVVGVIYWAATKLLSIVPIDPRIRTVIDVLLVVLIVVIIIVYVLVPLLHMLATHLPR